MRRSTKFPNWRTGAASAAAAVFVLATLTGCLGTRPEPEPAVAPAPPPAPPPPPTPPPLDLAGRWKLSATGSGSCFMNFGNAAGAAQGTIAPEGGCPDNFFTSRKWTFEHGALIIRDHKGEALAQLSFADGRFDGRETSGTAVTLSRK